MPQFNPADEQQRIAEQDRQFQHAVKLLAGNIQEAEFSKLELRMKIGGEEVSARYEDHRFVDNNTGLVLADAAPHMIVEVRWRAEPCEVVEHEVPVTQTIKVTKVPGSEVSPE